MRLGLMLGYSGSNIELPIDLIKRAEELGYYAVWTAEAYGSDAVSPLAWIGAQTSNIKLGTAIMQIPARTPASAAMTAMTIDQLSGGRFLFGLGVSGPQVVEGWHGQPYDLPLKRTREYVGIVRHIFKRESPLVYDGDVYTIPYQGQNATGLGKPLKSILHGRSDIPIYLAAIGPKNIQQTAEIADGWLPIFFSPAYYDQVFKSHVDAGLAKSANPSKPFDIAPSVSVVVGDDLESCRNSVKSLLALYIGGMGAKDKNFYYNLACRYGYEASAENIQALFLAGERMSAIMAVPDALVDDVALCGPKERIKERLEIWRSVPITTLNVIVYDRLGLETMAELVL